jgi:hypothetical protein
VFQGGSGALRSGSMEIYEMEDRSKIRFWHNVWCGNQSLNMFPELFSIVPCMEAR